MQVKLAHRFCNGWGVVKDEEEAIKWYRKAVEQGNAYGQCYLGDCYLRGQGVAKDKAEAVKWFRRAAEQVDKDAISALHDWARNRW